MGQPHSPVPYATIPKQVLISMLAFLLMIKPWLFCQTMNLFLQFLVEQTVYSGKPSLSSTNSVFSIDG